jgi:hypothetical protein
MRLKWSVAQGSNEYTHFDSTGSCSADYRRIGFVGKLDARDTKTGGDLDIVRAGLHFIG